MTLESIADSLTETMPEVSDHAIAEHEAQERNFGANSDAPLATAQTARAPSGVEYNPNTHEVSPKTGKVIKKRRGGANSASKVAVSSASPAGTASSQNDEGQARATGKFAAAALIGICSGVFGDEFQPEKTAQFDERAYLESAFGDYFVATGRTDLPPSMALIVAIGAYTIPRFTKPKTKSKLSAFKDWAVSKYFGWRGKKTMADANRAANDENASK